ncbi:hypothetical protein [Aquimarina sediminis]|uniref:hypothetical protein n=1 Tax=Aquimarina sediminis TaxID=2070536 RepID=UPI000FFF31ED|nr:hypothetical protein [Aquimarina sediminis]
MNTSKSNILFFLPLVVMMIALSSCRNESDLIVEADENQVIKPDSKIASLMSKVSMNDGSIDNIIDNSTCFTVKLPITVIANGSEVLVSSVADFQVIEDIFMEFDNDIDELEIIYPVTLILMDYTEISVENETELENINNSCSPTDENLECIDFKYPFSVSVFDSESELIQVLSFNNDKELFLFLKNLKEEDITSIKFPITVIFSDDTEIIVNDIDNLQQIIEDTIDDCNDGDTTTDLFAQTIINGSWEVQKYKDNQSNETKNYKDFIFTFLENGSISVENTSTNEITTGSWSTITLADGTINANLDFGTQPPLDKLNKSNWNVKKVQDNRIMLDEKDNDGISKDELFFKKL